MTGYSHLGSAGGAVTYFDFHNIGGGDMTDHQTTVAQLRTMMKDFVAQRQWEKFHTPRNLAASAAVEAGELLELFQWLGDNEAMARLQEPAFRQAVADEMSDVLMYIISLANALDLDISAAAEAKMARNRTKYPAEKFRGHYQRPLKSQQPADSSDKDKKADKSA